MVARTSKPSNPGNWAKLKTRWPERAEIAAKFLSDTSSVVDIGCGAGSLRFALPVDIKYTGVDIVARDDDTVVVDLNSDPLPKLEAEAAAVLGVLEYLNDPLGMLRQMKTFKRSVISYNHFSLRDIAVRMGLIRSKVVWRNRYTAWAFRRMLKTAGLRIVSTHHVRHGELLYVCTPAR